jgi:hypothetical protein
MIMDILKSKKTAAAVLCIVIIIFTPIGSKLSLQRAADKVEDMFYDGVYNSDEKYTAGAIDTYLQSRIQASLGLITVGANDASLSEETDALRNARNALLDADSIEEKYQANVLLEEAWNTLYDAITAKGGDANADAYADTLSGAQGAIAHSGYNEAVAEFTEGTMHRFPANLISKLLSVKAPQSFGGN